MGTSSSENARAVTSRSRTTALPFFFLLGRYVKTPISFLLHLLAASLSLPPDRSALFAIGIGLIVRGYFDH